MIAVIALVDEITGAESDDSNKFDCIRLAPFLAQNARE